MNAAVTKTVETHVHQAHIVEGRRGCPFPGVANRAIPMWQKLTSSFPASQLVRLLWVNENALRVRVNRGDVNTL